mmetsp:Transcript_47445/g.117453  ORF Transcript_47445/g.117453 Transcript_47445/m.117453 type:complete len:266 (+) Transcript_47445:388-1185(+)
MPLTPCSISVLSSLTPPSLTSSSTTSSSSPSKMSLCSAVAGAPVASSAAGVAASPPAATHASACATHTNGGIGGAGASGAAARDLIHSSRYAAMWRSVGSLSRRECAMSSASSPWPRTFPGTTGASGRATSRRLGSAPSRARAPTAATWCAATAHMSAVRPSGDTASISMPRRTNSSIIVSEPLVAARCSALRPAASVAAIDSGEASRMTSAQRVCPLSAARRRGVIDEPSGAARHPTPPWARRASTTPTWPAAAANIAALQPAA